MVRYGATSRFSALAFSCASAAALILFATAGWHRALQTALSELCPLHMAGPKGLYQVNSLSKPMPNCILSIKIRANHLCSKGDSRKSPTFKKRLTQLARSSLTLVGFRVLVRSVLPFVLVADEDGRQSWLVFRLVLSPIATNSSNAWLI